MKNRQAINFRTGGASLLILAIVFLKADAGNDTLQVPDNVNCACPGEVLTYICNVNGGGTTLWGGSAFNCPSTSNEIRLRHSQFSLAQGTSGSCNNEAMRARSIGVTNTVCYISELDVTVSSSFNNRIIRCNHDSGSGERVIGMSTLTVVSAPEPPSDIRFIELRNRQVVLTWTPIESTCVPTYYRVMSNCSNVTCSSSAIATNLTTDSCSIPQQFTDVLVCAFSVQGMVCGNLMGRLSNPAVVTLQEPTLTIVPRYFSNSNSLSRFIVLGSNLRIAKSDITNIFITVYNVTFSDPDTDGVIYSAPFSTCGEDACETDITPPSLSQVCPSLTVIVTADYGLGQTMLSDPTTIGCINQFVDVQYNPADSTISCTFLNPMDTSSKLCSVTYDPCGQKATQTLQGRSTSAIITLSIMPHGSDCYIVTASNDNFTVAVEGMIQSGSEGSNSGAIIGGVVGGFIVLMVTLTIALVVIQVIIRRKDVSKSVRLRDIVPSSQSVKEKLKLEPITDRNFKKIEIDKDCKLREAIEYAPKKLMFKRGHAYYEFTHKKENISEDKELIFINKDSGEFLSPNVNLDVLYDNKLLGEGVWKPGYKEYRVFVQSTGSGARHLPAGSLLLYEQVKTNPWNPKEAPLQPVISNHFMTTTVKSECTVEQFQKQNNLETRKANVFIEYGDPNIKDIRDVILMDKKTGKLFTGPIARSNPSAHLQNYRVFLLQYDTKLNLKPGKTILHQNPELTSEQFYVLEVDKDNIQLSEFIKDKLQVKFENGKAFYEFSQMEEDLLYYRDVVRMTTKGSDKQDGIKILDLDSSIKHFYWLSSSVPDVGIKPPKFDQYRVFVQSTSQGSRCLKARTLLLYKFFSKDE